MVLTPPKNPTTWVLCILFIYLVKMPTLAESYPVSAPKPSSKPKLFVHETDLTVTPEKMTKVVNEGKTRNRKKHSDAKKKVMFKENKVKDMFLEPCP